MFHVIIIIEDSPLITEDQDHDENASSVVIGQGDTLRRNTRTTLSSDINPPNIIPLSKRDTHIRQETDGTPGPMLVSPPTVYQHLNMKNICKLTWFNKIRRYT